MTEVRIHSQLRSPRLRQRDAVLDGTEQLIEAILFLRKHGEVVVRTQGGCRQIVLQGDSQRLPKQRTALVRPVAEDECLRVEGLRDDLGDLKRLGNLEGELDPIGREPRLAPEEVETGQPVSKPGQIAVRLVCRQDAKGEFHLLDRLIAAASLVQDLPQPC